MNLINLKKNRNQSQADKLMVPLEYNIHIIIEIVAGTVAVIIVLLCLIYLFNNKRKNK